MPPTSAMSAGMTAHVQVLAPDGMTVRINESDGVCHHAFRHGTLRSGGGARPALKKSHQACRIGRSNFWRRVRG
jgi:hypothetical protein